MLELDPRKRWTCRETGELLSKMIITEQKARERSTSPSSSSSPSASAAPAGPKSASPTERHKLSSAAKEQSPLSVVSPERDLPGRAIPSCYSQFSDSNYTRLSTRRDSSSSSATTVSAAGTLTGGSPVRPSTGASPVRVSSAERSLQNALNERRMSMLSRVRTRKLDSSDLERSNTAQGKPHMEFSRTKSRSMSPRSRCKTEEEEPQAGAKDEEGRTGRASKRTTKIERTPSREAPHRVEGNFVDRMNPTWQRRAVEIASAPASATDGMAKASAAAGRFLQRRSDTGAKADSEDRAGRSPLAGRPKTSAALSRSPVRLQRNVESAGMSAKRLSTAGGAKTLARTCEVRTLQRTCEVDGFTRSSKG